MKFACIQKLQATFPVQKMCAIFEVSSSGYYAFRKRKPSKRKKANENLVSEIKKIFQESRKTYGSPRMVHQLRQNGVICSRNRVARLMRDNNLSVRRKRRKHPRTTQRAAGALAAPNLLKQKFTVREQNQIWVSDITYIDTRNGWLYLATTMDLFDRRIIGWTLENHMEASLVKDAFQMAVAQRHPQKGLIHHSDQGSQYTSQLFRNALAEVGSHPSNSGVGNCYDNAPAESFFSTLKFECANYQFPTWTEARRKIFE